MQSLEAHACGALAQHLFRLLDSLLGISRTPPEPPPSTLVAAIAVPACQAAGGAHALWHAGSRLGIFSAWFPHSALEVLGHNPKVDASQKVCPHASLALGLNTDTVSSMANRGVLGVICKTRLRL